MKKATLHVVFIALVGTLTAQQPASSPVPLETPQELRDRLSPGQQQQFDQAMAAFQARRFSESLGILNQLRELHPRDPLLAKEVTEVQLNTGDATAAVATIKPIVDAAPADWQAVNLLARACAESGDAACRDAQLAHLADLHHQGLTPPNRLEYQVEQIKSGVNTLSISTALEPIGPYKMYARGRVTNPEGKLFLTITLESNDGDQPAFAKEHPKESAAGERRFSLDAYAETGLNPAGQRTQTHYTFKFIDGQPNYDTIKSEFIAVASGKSHPISSRSGLIVP